MKKLMKKILKSKLGLAVLVLSVPYLFQHSYAARDKPKEPAETHGKIDKAEYVLTHEEKELWERFFKKYGDFILYLAENADIDWKRYAAILDNESRFQHFNENGEILKSPENAYGVGQLKYIVYKDLKGKRRFVKNSRDEKNIHPNLAYAAEAMESTGLDSLFESGARWKDMKEKPKNNMILSGTQIKFLTTYFKNHKLKLNKKGKYDLVREDVDWFYESPWFEDFNRKYKPLWRGYDIWKAVSASYNCGPDRVKKIMREYGPEWEKHLPGQTQKYLVDCSITRELFSKIGSKMPGAFYQES